MKKRFKLYFGISLLLCMFLSSCATIHKCPTTSDFLKKFETYDRDLKNDFLRVRVFSFPLPNNLMGSIEELQPYGEIVEKWINETGECDTVIGIGLAIDGIRVGEDFRRLVFTVFYRPPK